MATPKRSEVIARARSAGEMFNDIQKAVEQNKVPQLAELLTKVSDRIGIDRIAEVIADSITTGKDDTKRKFALEFAALLKQYQQMTGEITKDEITRMTDMQIESILRDEYGFEESNGRENRGNLGARSGARKNQGRAAVASRREQSADVADVAPGEVGPDDAGIDAVHPAAPAIGIPQIECAGETGDRVEPGE